MKRLLLFALALVLAVATGAAPLDAQTKTETPAASTKTDAKKAPLDVNTASLEELQALPGIGEVYSKKIVDNRPYARKDEIVRKAGVPQATYDKIKDQIVAKQSTDKKK